MNSVFAKLSQLDRRIIYLIISFAVIAPFFFRLGLPIRVSPEVKMLYDYIERLGPTDCVLISGDYDPQVDAELSPMFEAITRHCFKKGVKLMVVNVFSIQGMGLLEPKLKRIAEEEQKIYGVDYVFMGYRPGGGLLILGMADNISKTWQVDYYGTKATDIPMLKTIRKLSDIDLSICLTGSGAYGVWISYAYIRNQAKVAAGITAVMAADAYPALQAGQLVGLVGGLRGAAEYEQLVEHPALASVGMEAQSWAHITIILFILLGNIGFFLSKRKQN